MRTFRKDAGKLLTLWKVAEQNVWAYFRFLRKLFRLSRNTSLRWWEEALRDKLNNGTGDYCITCLYVKWFHNFLIISLYNTIHLFVFRFVFTIL